MVNICNSYNKFVKVTQKHKCIGTGTASSFLNELDISVTLTFYKNAFQRHLLLTFTALIFVVFIVMKLRNLVNFLSNEYWIGLYLFISCYDRQ